jgi:transaldolase
MVKEKNYDVGFIGGGARGLHHFTEMVGADCNITINWRGTADKLIEQDPPVVQRFLQPTPHSAIDALTEKVEDYRRAYFVNAITAEEYDDFGPVEYFRNSFEDAWSKMDEFIKKRRKELGL